MYLPDVGRLQIDLVAAEAAFLPGCTFCPFSSLPPRQPKKAHKRTRGMRRHINTQASRIAAQSVRQEFPGLGGALIGSVRG